MACYLMFIAKTLSIFTCPGRDWNLGPSAFKTYAVTIIGHVGRQRLLNLFIHVNTIYVSVIRNVKITDFN